jgi:hypothetical protein
MHRRWLIVLMILVLPPTMSRLASADMVKRAQCGEECKAKRADIERSCDRSVEKSSGEKVLRHHPACRSRADNAYLNCIRVCVKM